MKRAAGFTLIEVLVAIALVACAMTLSWRALAAVSNGAEQLNRQIDVASDMDRLFARLERETLHRVRSSLGGGVADNQRFVSFTSLAPDEAGRLQRVNLEYRLAGSRLYLITRDEMTAGAPRQDTLFDEVDTFAVRFMAEDGAWVSAWQQGEPRALEVRLKLRGEEGVRMFALP